jgi:glutaredoxin 3
VQAALRATPIIMYSTSWCTACARARAFLDANRLTRIEHDIDTDERAREDLRRLAGKLSVPVFLVDGTLVGPGFSEASLKRAIVGSVEKRLSVHGIEARSTGAF